MWPCFPYSAFLTSGLLRGGGVAREGCRQLPSVRNFPVFQRRRKWSRAASEKPCQAPARNSLGKHLAVSLKTAGSQRSYRNRSKLIHLMLFIERKWRQDYAVIEDAKLYLPMHPAHLTCLPPEFLFPWANTEASYWCRFYFEKRHFILYKELELVVVRHYIDEVWQQLGMRLSGGVPA